MPPIAPIRASRMMVAGSASMISAQRLVRRSTRAPYSAAASTSGIPTANATARSARPEERPAAAVKMRVRMSRPRSSVPSQWLARSGAQLQVLLVGPVAPPQRRGGRGRPGAGASPRRRPRRGSRKTAARRAGRLWAARRCSPAVRGCTLMRSSWGRGRRPRASSSRFTITTTIVARRRRRHGGEVVGGVAVGGPGRARDGEQASMMTEPPNRATNWTPTPATTLTIGMLCVGPVSGFLSDRFRRAPVRHSGNAA